MLRAALFAAALLISPAALADGEEEATEEKAPTKAERLHQLRGERTEIFEELTALEEGYSELVDHDAKALEARVDALMERLKKVDQQIAALTDE